VKMVYAQTHTAGIVIAILTLSIAAINL